MKARRRTNRKASGIPDWLSVQQVADHLQVSRVTVWRWLRFGRLCGIKVGRVRRIAKSSLQELSQEGRGRSATPATKKGRAVGTVFTLTHPLWELVGKGRGGGTDVSGHKYKYIAKAIDRR
ncbi:MAG: helix-turn-helix domain-containing protein [candidate division NC10 bacterium]|nr:helix-turn-helix domain-containing protein [candidate division NC10 bacterium]